MVNLRRKRRKERPYCQGYVERSVLLLRVD
jgi:hypothetical protein